MNENQLRTVYLGMAFKLHLFTPRLNIEHEHEHDHEFG